MRRLAQLHPLLFASYGSLALLANNLGQIEVSAALRSFAISLVVSALLVVVLSLLLQDFSRAALLSSGAILLIFSYGHVSRLLASLLPAAGTSLAMPILWALTLAIWTFVVLRRVANPHLLAQYFVAFGLVLNALPAYTLLTYTGSAAQAAARIGDYRRQAWAADGFPQPTPTGTDGSPSADPDIYYLVLDAYTRADVLQELYGYDNRPFLDALRARGFVIADASRANYPRTELSIASSLNMMHLTDLPEFLRTHDLEFSDRSLTRAATEMVKHNRTVELLTARGYTILAFESGYAAASLAAPDRLLRSPDIEEQGLWQAGFEVMLLDTTVGRELTRRLGDAYNPMQPLFDAHRERVLFTLAHLAEGAQGEGPHFVYAHVVSPHVPYVFGPNGQRISATDPYTLLNARPGDEDNVRRYRDQLHYLNGLVLDAVDQILAVSPAPPIIVIQGDHSSKVYSDATPSARVQRLLQFPIVNAYYLPAEAAAALDPAITPVNSFRLIWREVFETPLPLLPDRSYSLQSGPDGPQLVEVCTAVSPCR